MFFLFSVRFNIATSQLILSSRKKYSWQDTQKYILQFSNKIFESDEYSQLREIYNNFTKLHFWLNWKLDFNSLIL